MQDIRRELFYEPGVFLKASSSYKQMFTNMMQICCGKYVLMNNVATNVYPI